jgi:hypothetical protein
MRARSHFQPHFVCERHSPAMLGVSYGDKAYIAIRRGAKLAPGALEMLCSRKGGWN